MMRLHRLAERIHSLLKLGDLSRRQCRRRQRHRVVVGDGLFKVEQGQHAENSQQQGENDERRAAVKEPASFFLLLVRHAVTCSESAPLTNKSRGNRSQAVLLGLGFAALRTELEWLLKVRSA